MRRVVLQSDLDGIVLTAETVPAVPQGSALGGQTLTHVGGRKVGEVVADVDRLRAIADVLRPWPGTAFPDVVAKAQADDLDAIADRMLAPVLVQAWHDQHPRGGDE